VELHGGAGRGYPVLEVVVAGEEVVIRKRRTSWYLLETRRGSRGWAPRAQLLRTLTPEGEPFPVEEEAKAPGEHDFEVGAWLGDFDGGALMGLHGAWRYTPNLALEAALQQAVGRVADSLLIDLTLAGHPFPGWRYAPYFGVATGIISTTPSSTLVNAQSRDDQTLGVALGVQRAVSRTFMFRLEYRQYLLLTSRDDHEKLATWKAGLAVFY
jgi:hypothetical protein